MPGSGIYLQQYIYSYIDQPSVTYSSEAVLDTPLLLYPINGINLCESSTLVSGESSGIVLAWTAVTGADFYIVQFCRNSSFNGPTFQGRKTATNSYTLNYLTDIRLGAEYHWRVMAYSTDGSVSAKSETRNFVFDCEPFSGGDKGNPGTGEGNPPQDSISCEGAGVSVEIDGPRQVMCCDTSTWNVNIQFDCDDGLYLDSVYWRVNQSDVGGHEIIAQNNKYITVSTSTTASEMFEIEANAFFINVSSTYGYFFDAYTYLDQFYCSDKFRVFSDCYSGKPSEKPWLQVYYEPFPGVIHYIDPAYADETLGEEYTVVNDTKNKFILPVKSSGIIAVGPVVLTGTTEYSTYNYDPCSVGIDIGARIAQRLEARVHLHADCGIAYSDDHGFYVDPNIAGDGLYWNNCGLYADLGCGLTIVDNKITINAAVLAGAGLTESVPCVLDINYACGLYINDYNELDLNFYGITSGLSGLGVEDQCRLYINVGCGTYIDADNFLTVDLATIVSSPAVYRSGLSTSQFDGQSFGRCDLYILPGCGIHITEDNELSVNAFFFAYSAAVDYTGLSSSDGCDLYILTDCGIYITQDNKIALDTSIFRYGFYVDGCYIDIDCDYCDQYSNNYYQYFSDTIYMLQTEFKEVVTDIYCYNNYLYKVTEMIRVVSDYQWIWSSYQWVWSELDPPRQ